MKKALILFVSFCLVFALSLGLIYHKANSTVVLPEAGDIQWRGHIENSKGTYNGAILNELFSGEGEFKFISGEIYSGEWMNSHMSGNGTVIFPGVGVYSGEMAESKRNGSGTFTWESGAKYTGNWENDTMSGVGTYYFENGCALAGTFENNKLQEGTLTYEAENVEKLTDIDIQKLSCCFSKDATTVTFQTKGGLMYSGDLSGLSANGQASITYPSGNSYEGDVVKGKRNGTGKFFWKDKSGKVTACYDGQWIDDHMNGQGKYFYSGGGYPYLQGTFVKDKPDGKLTYYKAAGNTFETTWSNGSCTNVKET